mmetsp:Transcript_28587/g.61460  ORF Transcript_28587/g.61460 Transcript_28587/m.61460 type:complete len:840 (-) Transcript_28587:175-2694(-)
MSGNMDMFGDLGAGGVVLSRDELVERRQRTGQCPTCGQRCFEKKLFKMKPLTIPGKVSKGRCLACNPQDPNKEQLEAVVAVASGGGGGGGGSGGSVVSGGGGGSGGGGSGNRQRRSSTDSTKSSSRAPRSRQGVSATLSASMPNNPSSTVQGTLSNLRGSLQSKQTKLRSFSSLRRSGSAAMGNIEEADHYEDDSPDHPPAVAASSRGSKKSLKTAGTAVVAAHRASGGRKKRESPNNPASVAQSNDNNSFPSDGSTRSKDRDRNRRATAEDAANNGGRGSRSGTSGGGGSGSGGRRRRKVKNVDFDEEGEEGEEVDLNAWKQKRRASQNQEAYIGRQTPRPSALFLEGINIEDLFRDDELDDHDDDDLHAADHNLSSSTNNYVNGDSDNDGGGGGERASPIRRLSMDERQALQTLNSNKDMSFLDIVNIMLMNSMSATVNNEGLHALSLVHDPKVELLEECAESCGFEVIVSAMGQCGKDAMAQTNACKVLFIASAAGEDLQIAIGHAGGIEALVDAMKEFEDDVIVLEGCLLALSNLCIPRENLDLALGTEMIELAVNAMSQNVENCGLQEHGCAVLANLAVHEAARVRIRNCGGCDTVVVSMVVNPMDVGVQAQALVSLRNLCVGDEENKVLLANAGAIDVVIQAMHNHRDDPTIQARCSWVLSIIGTNEDNKLYMGECGGPEAVTRSMWVFPDQPNVQEKGCRALWTMSVHPQNRLTIVEVDAVPAIVAAMQNHAAEPSIQERGCGVLCNLAANDDDLKIQIVEDGALDVVVMAMVLHGENEFIQERAVALVHKLCIPENVEAMVNANVSPMMAVVGDNFPECQERASYILSYLG